MDKIKRRALLNPGVLAQQGDAGAGGSGDPPTGQAARGPRLGFGANPEAGLDVNAVVNGMAASGVRISFLLAPVLWFKIAHRSNVPQSSTVSSRSNPKQQAAGAPHPWRSYIIKHETCPSSAQTLIAPSQRVRGAWTASARSRTCSAVALPILRGEDSTG